MEQVLLLLQPKSVREGSNTNPAPPPSYSTGPSSEPLTSSLLLYGKINGTKAQNLEDFTTTLDEKYGSWFQTLYEFSFEYIYTGIYYPKIHSVTVQFKNSLVK